MNTLLEEKTNMAFEWEGATYIARPGMAEGYGAPAWVSRFLEAAIGFLDHASHFRNKRHDLRAERLEDGFGRDGSLAQLKGYQLRTSPSSKQEPGARRIERNMRLEGGSVVKAAQCSRSDSGSRRRSPQPT